METTSSLERKTMNLKLELTFVIGVLLGVSQSLMAQDISMTVGTANGTTGGTITVATTLDNNSIAPVAGWSNGLCNDPAVSPGVPTDTGLWDFNERAAFPDGVTQGVVICFTGCNPIPGGTVGTEMYQVTYTLAPSAPPGQYDLIWCNTLGSPPVSTVVVVNGASLPPLQNNGSLMVTPPPTPEYNYEAPDVGPYNYPSTDGIGGMSFSVDCSISETDIPGSGFPNNTSSFAMGLSHDGSLIDASSVEEIGVLAGLNGGLGPDIFDVATFSNGLTVGCAYSHVGFTLAFPSSEPVVRIEYSGVMGALVGVNGTTTSSLTWENGLGIPPVSNLVAIAGGPDIVANLSNGTITFNGTTTVAFETGDANSDGIVNVADIVWILQELFQGGTPSACPIALDVNGDGTTDIADAQYLASYIFMGGPAPADPFGTCATRIGQTPEDCSVAGCTP